MTNEKAITVRPPRDIQRSPANDVTAMLNAAIEKGVTVDGLRELVTLHERVADRQAALEFNQAMADFQEQCPLINKSKMVDYVTRSGVRINYAFAPLDEIARTVRPLLHALGLSYSWDSTSTGGTVTAVCTLRHVNGHSVSSQFSAPVDGSPAMSGQQKQSGTMKFAMRQSLVQVLGLTMTDSDDTMRVPEDDAGITPHQIAELEALMLEVGADRAKFLKWAKVETLAEIRSGNFPAAIAALEHKRSK